jgi:hypothetical protein
MNKRFLIAWAMLFVAWMLGSFVVHGFLLSTDYTALQGKLYRTPEDSQKYFPLMLLAHILLSGAFAWIYARGHEPAKPWPAQGLRFGIAVALLTAVPTSVIYFVVQPTPAALAIKQAVLAGLLVVLLGLLVAWWYRERTA